jgi:hypothetical protein
MSSDLQLTLAAEEAGRNRADPVVALNPMAA